MNRSRPLNLPDVGKESPPNSFVSFWSFLFLQSQTNVRRPTAKALVMILCAVQTAWLAARRRRASERREGCVS